VDNLYNAIQEAKKQKDPALAISVIEAYAARAEGPKLKGEARFYIACLRQEAGDYQGAIKDLQATIMLCSTGSYTHYASEMSLGYAYAKLGLRDEAMAWYRKAMATATDHKGLVGGTALQSFLELKGADNLTDQDRALCEKVVQTSWDELQMDGQPDMADLLKRARSIVLRQRNPY